MPEIKDGSILLERYLVERLLGVGGSSAVYLVFDQILNRKVAIKFLHQWSTHSGSSIPLMRFEREAQSLSQLLHPNIIRVFRFGVLENNEAFLVMEYTQGETLRAFLDRKKAIPCNEAVAICLQICAGLEFAHSAQMVHRDLKPENIMIIENADEITVKILDFGLCKFVSEPDSVVDVATDTDSTVGLNLTETGLLIGTAAYMSPEQGMGEAVDYRSDIYSFGCILFEMIAGMPPFPGDAPGAILLSHMSEPMPRILELAPESGFPQLLQDLILKCTAKNKNDRYQNFSELLIDLIAIEKLNCAARFKAKATRTLGFTKAKFQVAIVVLLSILLLSIGYVFFTDQGKLILASQIQASQSASMASKSLLQMHRNLLKEHKSDTAKKMLELTVNSHVFQNWPPPDRAELLLGYRESYKLAKLDDDAFSTSILCLAETLDSVRHEMLREDPPKRELDALSKISQDLYSDKLSKKQWAAIYKEIQSKADAFPKGGKQYLLWPSALRCKAQVLGGQIQTADSKIDLAKHYVYAIMLASVGKEISLMFSMVKPALEFTKKNDMPYDEHLIHSYLCRYYLDTKQIDKARLELAALEKASKELCLSEAETVSRNQLRERMGIGEIIALPSDPQRDPDADIHHPLILRMLGRREH